MNLMQGDCLELMKQIPDGSVDMVLCDLPYGTTRCEWDRKIPFAPLWEQYKRVIKSNAAILLFGSQPFTTDLICSNRDWFRYEIIWEKTQPTGFYNAKKMPLRNHENIAVFYNKLPTYNPIKRIKGDIHSFGRKRSNSDYKLSPGKAYGRVEAEKAANYEWEETGERYPTSIIKFSNWNGALFGNNSKATKHPTQKPVPLLEYLIKTYTNPGDVILDNCMGSGSTGVACVNTGREFIGIEKDAGYFEIAKKRIEEAQAQMKLTI